MRVILVDDEEIALELLARQLQEAGDVELVASLTNPHEVLEAAVKLRPDAIFLDIEMGAVSGLELAERILQELGYVDIVFVTAYSQYAIEAFEVNALDYLLKPIQDKRLAKTLDRLRKGAKRTGRLSNQLRVNSLGSLQVRDGQNQALAWRTQKSKELFAYLLNSRDMAAHKSLIMEDVFPDKNHDQATSLLHTTIYQLRKNLEKLGFPKGIGYLNDIYQLNLPLNFDLEILNKILKTKDGDEKKISQLLKLYNGDLLEQEGYHWIINSQLNLKDQVITFLGDFARKRLAQGELEPILKTVLDKLYFMDPLNDDVAQMLITYYGYQGQGHNLEAFFQGFSQTLYMEVNLEPARETIDLYESWRAEGRKVF